MWGWWFQAKTLRMSTLNLPVKLGFKNMAGIDVRKTFSIFLCFLWSSWLEAETLFYLFGCFLLRDSSCPTLEHFLGRNAACLDGECIGATTFHQAQQSIRWPVKCDHPSVGFKRAAGHFCIQCRIIFSTQKQDRPRGDNRINVSFQFAVLWQIIHFLVTAVNRCSGPSPCKFDTWRCPKNGWDWQ